MGRLKNRERWEEGKADDAVLPPVGPLPRRFRLPCRSAPSGRRPAFTFCESRGHRRLRWLYRTIGGLALVMAGMVVREAQLAWGTPHYLKIIPPLESFLWWDSFSEVEQTKATLRAHALRAIAESRARYLQIRRRPALGVFSEDAIADRALSEEIERLNRQIAEFGGTDQEIMLTGELLHVLQKAERNNEWLDVFLASAYRWPTHDLVEWNVRRATEMGRQTGREDEVSNAIRYREGIPTKYRETHSTEEVANTRATEPPGSPSPRSQRPSRLQGAATGVGAP